MRRRFQGRLRRWVSWYLQQRRRARTTPPVEPALSPVEFTITDSSWNWNATNPSLVDVVIQWSANYHGQPFAQVEVWCGPTLIATVDDEGEFVHWEATDMETTLSYRVRYRNGDVVGAFSPAYPVTISLRP